MNAMPTQSINVVLFQKEFISKHLDISELDAHNKENLHKKSVRAVAREQKLAELQQRTKSKYIKTFSAYVREHNFSQGLSFFEYVYIESFKAARDQLVDRVQMSA